MSELKLDRETPITTQFGVSDAKYRAAIEAWDRAEAEAISARVSLRKAEMSLNVAQNAVEKACRECHEQLLLRMREEASK